MKRYLAAFGIVVAVILATLPAQPNNPPIMATGSNPVGNACTSGTPILYWSGTYCGCDNTGHYAAFGTGTVPSFTTNEVVSGGTTTFTLAHTPIVGTVQLFSGSAAIWPTADYTISGATITALSPITAGTLRASYRY